MVSLIKKLAANIAIFTLHVKAGKSLTNLKSFIKQLRCLLQAFWLSNIN